MSLGEAQCKSTTLVVTPVDCNMVYTSIPRRRDLIVGSAKILFNKFVLLQRNGILINGCIPGKLLFKVKFPDTY